MFNQLLGQQPFSIPQSRKEAMLLSGLNDLTSHHYEHCEQYRRVIDTAWDGPRQYHHVADVPFIPVGLFKEHILSSTQTQSMVLHSSGTTGTVPSHIVLDPETASRQSQAVVATFRQILGERRLPFLAIDTSSIIRSAKLTARGAGVLGMMKFGAKATFALDEELELAKEVLKTFVASNGGQKFLIFGFTFLVWSRLYQSFSDGELDLSNAILVHSGGWKKLESEKVSNEVFRAAFKRRFNLDNIYNFYGFVEQIGSILIEGPGGLLYPPNFTDIIVRRPGTWEEADVGETGVIQAVSLLPLSYPGHSVLTEDQGIVVSIDDDASGRFGKAIKIVGRVEKTELRGCSDVIASSVATQG